MLMEQQRSYISDTDKELVPARQRRVFLAEDDAEMRAMLRIALTREGYRVTEAASGTEALEALGDLLLGLGHWRESPDLLITDQRMPGCEGLELIEALRAVRARVPAILITAFGDDETFKRAFDMDETAVLDKPFDISLLMAIARRLLRDGSGGPEAFWRG
jgi:DNA-binding response OmpR family regulator